MIEVAGVAQVLTQSDEKKSAFLKRIHEKEAAREQGVRDRIDAETPKFLHWALKPLATGMVRTQQRRASQQGAQGEFSVGLRLWARLPKAWTIINDVVLEYKPGEYAQIDHIAIGPAGVFLIETKAWDGAILLKQDQCSRKEAGKWVRTHSPIHQNKTHQRRFCQWYNFHGLPEPLPRIDPIVVFTQASWLVADQCSMPVLTPREAISYLNRGSANYQLDEKSADRIVHTILTADPLPMAEAHRALKESPSPTGNPVQSAPPTQPNAVRIREGTTRDGRKYVRVRGTREAAHDVWEQYGKPGKLAADRFDKETFFFYCD